MHIGSTRGRLREADQDFKKTGVDIESRNGSARRAEVQGMLSVPVTESADNSHTGASVAHWWGVCCTCKVINGAPPPFKKETLHFFEKEDIK